MKYCNDHFAWNWVIELVVLGVFSTVWLVLHIWIKGNKSPIYVTFLYCRALFHNKQTSRKHRVVIVRFDLMLVWNIFHCIISRFTILSNIIYQLVRFLFTIKSKYKILKNCIVMARGSTSKLNLFNIKQSVALSSILDKSREWRLQMPCMHSP